MKAESKKQISKAEILEVIKSGSELSALGFQLKIGFDGKRAANNQTGLGNYSRFIIEQLAHQYPDNQYFVYTPKAKDRIVKNGLFLLNNVFLRLPQRAKFLWRSFGIKKQLQQDNIELFHGLSHEIPFGIHKTSIKSVVTIHDLIFLKKPEYYKFIDRKIYEWKSRYACQHADRIIAISERTKQDIMELYHIPEEKIEVVYQSCDDSFKTARSNSEREAVAQKYHLPEKYILNVGTIEERKNLLLIIEAMPNIAESHQLVVVGKATPYLNSVKERIKALNLSNRIIFLNHVPFTDLPGIYQNAQLFIYPSLYEGFGIPIIEALYSGIPVIAATGSCLEEAGGPHAVYVSPTDHVTLAKKITTLLENEAIKKEMADKGLAYAQKFNNNVLTEQLMNCYLKTLAQ